MNLLITLMVASDNICARPPTPWVVLNHQIHATGGVSGPLPWRWCLLCVPNVCCGWSCDVTSSSYVKKLQKHNPKVRSRIYFFVPPKPVPHQQGNFVAIDVFSEQLGFADLPLWLPKVSELLRFWYLSSLLISSYGHLLPLVRMASICDPRGWRLK